jgi:putative flippase GtrA
MVDVENRAARDRDSHLGWRAVISVLGGHRITYLMAGAMTAAVYYALLGLGLLFANGGIPYLFLVVVGHAITVVIVYPWYRLVVFRVSGESWLIGYLRFYAVGVSFLAASLAGLPIMVELLGIPIMAAQALIIAMSPPLSYAIHRTWTFRNRGNV